MTIADQLVGDACLDVLGPFAASPGVADERTRGSTSTCTPRASSIYGGTSQIQKGIIAERILGLPRSR